MAVEVGRARVADWNGEVFTLVCLQNIVWVSHLRFPTVQYSSHTKYQEISMHAHISLQADFCLQHILN